MGIWNKKIILYGNKKIQGDFRELFKELKIVKGGIYEGNRLSPVNLQDYIIVVCEKKADINFENLARGNHLEYRENYIYIEDFFAYYNPIFLKRKDRKLAIWGTGAAALELWEELDKRGFSSEIDFYIDNRREKTMFHGKKVVSPEEIKGRDDIYVVVATYRYHWEIYKQLEEYGYRNHKDYVHCTMVGREYTGLLEKVCFSDDRYPYFCNRPFGYCDVIGEELYLCCPDFLPVSAGSMQFEPFLDSWNSYIARIIRLSISNGTFVFCNKQYCNLFDFESCGKSQMQLGQESKDLHSECPNTLMVGIDYSCNLRCPSCRDRLCVASADERTEIERQAEDLLEHVIPNVGRLWMAGSGEVFFSPIYKKILNDERCQKRTGISILSNGSLFDEKEWKLIKGSYETIEIVISVDGVKDETIEKLRRGADARKIKKNLEYLGKMRKEGKVQKLFVSCVLQADNIAELYELLEYCREIGVDKVQFLKLKNNGVYAEDDYFNKVSVFDKDDRLKEEYRCYFTEELLMHPLADWFNSSETLGVVKKPRLDMYDTL